MPLGDFVGGQIYKAGQTHKPTRAEIRKRFSFFDTLFCWLAGGFYPVYFTSLGLIFAGMFYLWLIPESVEKATKISDSNNNKGDEEKQNHPQDKSPGLAHSHSIISNS